MILDTYGMPHRIYTPKVIADPVYGIVDIHPVLPMVETEEFQSLADKRQLGMSYLVFPSATHTRMAHSFGAYHATNELARRWLELGMVNEPQARALAGYALYHDIGHPAFSHVTEELCDEDNDQVGAKVIARLKQYIESCGIDFNLLMEMARHNNPLYLGVHDKNLGMEKLDYLERDGLYTILSRPAGIDYLRKHVYFIDGELMIDEKVVDNAIEVQNFYLKMYKNVYLRKASVIAQRMMQKMVYALIAEGTITASDLIRLTDSELVGIVKQSPNRTAQTLYGRLRRRELFKEALVIRHQKFASAHQVSGKAVAVFGLDDEAITKLISAPSLTNKNQEALIQLEEEIAGIAGIPPDDVLAVTVFNAWRFVPQDIAIYGEHGRSSLKERYPAHFHDMEEVARSYATFRVCTTEEHRKKISDPGIARRVFDVIAEKANHA